MKLTVSKVDVWTCELADQPGSLASKLEPLAAAGADLSYLVARRQADKPGTGVVYLGGLKGAKQAKAAAEAGFTKGDPITALRIDGANKPGIVQRIAAAVAAAGVNMRGVKAATVGNKFVTVLAFDTPEDAAKAAKAIRALK
ncbi:MAG: ACT domain-containing protein [Pirellulales bacterium]|nr:ACT domain-containing protein [Pirellulales bacterium]